MLFRESLLVHCDNETKNLNASVCVCVYVCVWGVGGGCRFFFNDNACGLYSYHSTV